MSEKPGSKSWPNVHPDFDGHLERPIEKMTMEERFIWAWQGMQLMNWAQRNVQVKPHDESDRSTPHRD